MSNPADSHDPVSGIIHLREKKELQTRDFDYSKYKSNRWVVVKTALALCMMTTAYSLYALHELPWTLFGSVTGILIVVMVPFFAGFIMGFSFESTTQSLVYSVFLGFVSIGLCLIVVMLPSLLNVSDSGFGMSPEVFIYGFFNPFLVTISFIPAGAAVSASIIADY